MKTLWAVHYKPLQEVHSIRYSHVTPVQSEENKMIDKLSREDYYDYSDYYDGLDGEHADIDYNEVRDYFED